MNSLSCMRTDLDSSQDSNDDQSDNTSEVITLRKRKVQFLQYFHSQDGSQHQQWVVPAAASMWSTGRTNPLFVCHSFPLLSPKTCDWLIEKAEDVGQQLGWTTDRHKNFPTVDIPLGRLGSEIEPFLRFVIKEAVIQQLSVRFGVEADILEPNDVFLVKVSDIYAQCYCCRGCRCCCLYFPIGYVFSIR